MLRKAGKLFFTARLAEPHGMWISALFPIMHGITGMREKWLSGSVAMADGDVKKEWEMGEAGIEPARSLRPLDFKSNVYAVPPLALFMRNGFHFF